jgi:hypothetical protein
MVFSLLTFLYALEAPTKVILSSLPLPPIKLVSSYLLRSQEVTLVSTNLLKSYSQVIHRVDVRVYVAPNQCILDTSCTNKRHKCTMLVPPVDNPCKLWISYQVVDNYLQC